MPPVSVGSCRKSNATGFSFFVLFVAAVSLWKLCCCAIGAWPFWCGGVAVGTWSFLGWGLDRLFWGFDLFSVGAWTQILM